ncbi:5502_t:CDS:2, partial [Racocetra persica]
STSESGPNCEKNRKEKTPLAPSMIPIASSLKVRIPPSQYKKNLTTKIIDLYLAPEVAAEKPGCPNQEDLKNPNPPTADT